jgi:predicted negative regulator of RcsB-dependent stress response
MNDVYENNMRFLPLLKFIEKYKKILTFIAITIILAITFLIISNQVAKKNNLEAASIYTSFLEELSSINPDDSELNNILDNLFLNYKNTGYTQIALLNKASLDARNSNLEQSLKNFKNLVNLTDGFNGNKIYNKIARVSAARILLSNDKYDDALNMIEKFSSNSTNGYIHELSGDILLKQNKIDLAISQYELASAKYNDETSKSIISMKISNIGK